MQTQPPLAWGDLVACFAGCGVEEEEVAFVLRQGRVDYCLCWAMPSVRNPDHLNPRS